MVQSSQSTQKYKLESQIREAYGRLVYTFTCHNKIIDRLQKRNNEIKVWQIVLSALTTGSFLATIINNEVIFGALGAALSISLLILNSYMKNTDLIEISQTHQKAADDLWHIREEYVSLLTDIDLLEVKEIMCIRDKLKDRTGEVYSKSPRTDLKSYKQAQKALITEEEQTFSDKEIDVMLPNSIRRNYRK